MLWAKGGYCSQIGRVSIYPSYFEYPATFNLLISNIYETAQQHRWVIMLATAKDGVLQNVLTYTSTRNNYKE